MLQNNYILKFNSIAKFDTSIQSIILIGSFGRNNPDPNSDIDYQLLIDENFDNKQFLNLIQNKFKNQLRYFIYLSIKQKWCFYIGDDYQKLEIFLCRRLEDLNKYYLGSEIEDIEKSIIFDKTNTIKKYLEKITKEKKEKLHLTQKEKIKNLIESFQNRFEDASFSHAKSDGYKFYILFSHALDNLVKIIYLCEGGIKHDYMPSNFLTKYSYPKKLKIETLENIMDLRKANQNKQFLLDLFKQYLPIAITKFELSVDDKKIGLFLENIFRRDYFWNFRDASKFNSKLKSKILYRTSTLSYYQDEPYFKKLLDDKNIKQIIDLRAKDEIQQVQENNYAKEKIKLLSYASAPFNPCEQSIEFKNTYNTGTNAEKAYHFFMVECKPSIKKIVGCILANDTGATAIHCQAGKDRTGVVITLLHLLVGANKKEIENDYLASEMDTDLKLLDIVFEHVDNHGGVVEYLKSCGLSNKKIEDLKKKISF